MAKILIVDDAAYFRTKLKKILESMGHEVVGEAMDGINAGKMYIMTKPDLVTMDISMPKANGIEGVKNIIGKDENAKIIMISSRGQRHFVLEAMRYGAKHFVLKPFDVNTLKFIITDVLERD